MSIRDEIHDAVALELEDFKMPTILCIGHSKYDQLLTECEYTDENQVYAINTAAGNLQIYINGQDPDYLWVGDNILLNVLNKLGVK